MVARLLLWLDVLGFVAGLAMILVGAEGVVRGGSGLARRLGVSPLLVGLTIVALGTSAPELVVSVTASAQGDGAIALGNVLGSNILNILIVLGVAGLVTPIKISRGVREQDLPIMLMVTSMLWVLAATDGIGLFEAIMALIFVPTYLLRLYQREVNVGILKRRVIAQSDARISPLIALLAIGAGIGLLVLGGRWVVDNGIVIADAMGVPERVVAITLVAFGTSAPELATSILAALRGRPGLAVGNAIGSNFLNLYMVLGAAALVNPIPVDRGALLLDFPVAVAAVGLMWLTTRGGVLSRRTAAGFVSLYGVYLLAIFLLPL